MARISVQVIALQLRTRMFVVPRGTTRFGNAVDNDEGAYVQDFKRASSVGARVEQFNVDGRPADRGYQC